MALNVFKNREVQKVIGEIEAHSQAHSDELDKFFWLKAARTGDGKGLKFYEAKDLCKGDTSLRAFRIANIVLQGGGVLGLVHAGFVTGMEVAGVRFAGIAGASAGAVMAIGMAAVRGDDLLTETHQGVVKIVGEMPMSAFIDGPFRTRRLIKQYLGKRLSLWPSEWPAWFGAIRQILWRRGLNPGHAFEDWLEEVLREYGLQTIANLSDRVQTIADQMATGLEHKRNAHEKTVLATLAERVADAPADLGKNLLQIMAAAMPIGIKFQFPKDADQLSIEVSANSPAALVRASMAIPLFFEPKVFPVKKESWANFMKEKLEELLDKSELKDFSNLDEVAFLDGGMFSNLPSDAFDNDLPEVPTVAVPLKRITPVQPYRRRARLSSLFSEAGTISYLVRNHRDRDALELFERRKKAFGRRQTILSQYRQNLESAAGPAGLKPPDPMPPTFPFRLASINVEDRDWLNFTMDESEMLDLFQIGLRRAKKFLEDLKHDKD